MAKDTATINVNGGPWSPLPEAPAGLPEESLIGLAPLKEELAEIETFLAWARPVNPNSAEVKMYERVAERIRRRIWQGVNQIEEATPQELSPRLSVSDQTIRNWCERGHVEYRKVGPKYLVDVRSAYAYAARR